MQELFLENLTSVWVIKSLWSGPAHHGGRVHFILSPLSGPNQQVSGDGTTHHLIQYIALDPVKTLQNVIHILHEWPAEGTAQVGIKEERGELWVCYQEISMYDLGVTHSQSETLSSFLLRVVFVI